MSNRLQVGLLGLGRLGIAYTRHISGRIPEMDLVAVADTAPGRAQQVAAEFNVRHSHLDASELINNPSVDTIVIATPTDSHRAITVAALEAGKPTFCEKPPSIVVSEAEAMRSAAARTGTFLQIGFMRRFDKGYAAAKKQIESGAIGQPVMFKSCSRDPSPPDVSYADPRSSGGTIVDMGIHDFDLARWLVGEVATVHATAGVLACPEFRSINDVDTAIVSLRFADGSVGVVDLSRNSGYGYDIRTEILGTHGAVQIGYLRETPILVMTRNSISHDTIPHFPERFENAYVTQLQDFAKNVIAGKPPSTTIDDGIAALTIGLAATESHAKQQPVALRDFSSPSTVA